MVEMKCAFLPFFGRYLHAVSLRHYTAMLIEGSFVALQFFVKIAAVNDDAAQYFITRILTIIENLFENICVKEL